MCSCHSIPECCVMFSGVKLSMGSFVLFVEPLNLSHKCICHLETGSSAINSLLLKQEMFSCFETMLKPF